MGSITLGTVAGLSFAVGDGQRDRFVSFTGSLATVNAALSGLTYVPRLDWHGTDTLNVTACDQGNTGAGGARTASASLPLLVQPVNDAPIVSVPARQTVDEDHPARLRGVSVFDVDAGDVAGAVMEVTLVVLGGRLRLRSQSGLSLSSSSGAVLDPLTLPRSMASGAGQPMSAAALCDGWTARKLTVTGPLASLNAALAELTYFPDDNTNSVLLAESLSVLVTDRGTHGTPAHAYTTVPPLTAAAAIPMTVRAVNDAPVIHLPPAQQVGLLGFSVVDPDIAGGLLRVSVRAGSGQAVLSLASTTGLTFETAQGGGNGAAPANLLDFKGSATDVNTALAGLQYSRPTGVRGGGEVELLLDDGKSAGEDPGFQNTAFIDFALDNAPSAGEKCW